MEKPDDRVFVCPECGAVTCPECVENWMFDPLSTDQCTICLGGGSDVRIFQRYKKRKKDGKKKDVPIQKTVVKPTRASSPKASERILHIAQDVADELARWYWASSSIELAGLGLVEQDGQDYRWTKIFLTWDEHANGGGVNVTGAEQTAILLNVVRDGGDPRQLRLHWHFHTPGIGAFWSSADCAAVDKQVLELDGGVVINVVCAGGDDALARLDSGITDKVAIALKVRWEGGTDEQKRIRALQPKRWNTAGGWTTQAVGPQAPRTSQWWDGYEFRNYEDLGVHAPREHLSPIDAALGDDGGSRPSWEHDGLCLDSNGDWVKDEPLRCLCDECGICDYLDEFDGVDHLRP